MHCTIAKRKKLVTARSFPHLSWHKLPHHHLSTTYTRTNIHTPPCTLLITLKCCVRLEHWCEGCWKHKPICLALSGKSCCTNLEDHLCLPTTHTHTHILSFSHCSECNVWPFFFIWASALFSQLDFSKYRQNAESILFILTNRWWDYWRVLLKKCTYQSKTRSGVLSWSERSPFKDVGKETVQVLRIK